ncbi:hypothetical protein LCGC14_2624630, partial [marine sediment metagenome]
ALHTGYLIKLSKVLKTYGMYYALNSSVI